MSSWPYLSRRAFLRASVVLGAATLAACAPKAVPTAAPTAKPAEKAAEKPAAPTATAVPAKKETIPIQYWIFWGQPQVCEEAWRATDEWQQMEADGLEIEFRTSAGGDAGKTAVAAGTPPDVGCLGPQLDFALGGVLLDLNPFVDASDKISRDMFFSPVNIPDINKPCPYNSCLSGLIECPDTIVHYRPAIRKKNRLVIAEMELIIGQLIFLKPPGCGISSFFVPEARYDDIKPHLLQGKKEFFCISVRLEFVLSHMDLFQNPEKILPGDIAFETSLASLEVVYRYVGIIFLQIFKKNRGQVPEGVVNIDNDFFHDQWLWYQRVLWMSTQLARLSDPRITLWNA